MRKVEEFDSSSGRKSAFFFTFRSSPARSSAGHCDSYVFIAFNCLADYYYSRIMPIINCVLSSLLIYLWICCTALFMSCSWKKVMGCSQVFFFRVCVWKLTNFLFRQFFHIFYFIFRQNQISLLSLSLFFFDIIWKFITFTVIRFRGLTESFWILFKSQNLPN